MSALFPFRAGLLALAAAAALTAAPALAQSAPQTYDLPAQPLGSTLARIAAMGQFQISLDAELVRGLTAPPVRGRLTARQAAEEALAGSGLELTRSENGNWSVRRLQPVAAGGTTPVVAAAGAAGALPQIEVRGEGVAETALGPVAGYRATRAVTASKTDTPLSETPQAVTVVTRDQFTDQGANTLQEALRYAAGVRADLYGLDSRSDGISIRGADADSYIDGLRQTNDYYTSTARPEPYTLERIEVLRGPAAMLYGQGSTGGVVNMVSKRPQAEFQGEVGVQVGNYGRKQIQADITGPLTADGQWLYRLVAVGRDSDTQVDQVRDNRALLMPTLTWRPDAATSLTLQGLYQNDKTGSTNQFFPWAGTVSANPNGQLPTSRFIGEPDDHYDTQRRSLGYQFEHRFNDRWTLRQNFRYAANKVDYLSRYADFFSLPGGWAEDPVNQRVIGRVGSHSLTKVRIATLDQHLQGKLQTGSVQHTLLAGADLTRYRNETRNGYASDTIDAYAPVYGQGAPVVLGDPVLSHQRQTGIYLQDQMKIDRNWIVVAGLRHDQVTNSLVGSEDEKSSATTKRLGAMYLLANGWSPYVSYSESFTPVAGTNVYGERYKPLRGEQIEGGVKYMPAGGNMQFTAAAYKLREKNHSTVDPTNANNTVQVASTKINGVEFEYKATLARAFDVIANYNYTDIDPQLTQMSRQQGSVWGKWRFSVAGVQGLSVGAGVRYVGSFRDGSAPVTPSAALVDALIAWDQPHWRYALNIANLGDKTYVTSCLSRGDCWYGARRTVIASATYRF